MTADMLSSAGEDGTDGLGTVPSVLQILRTDGTVDNTVHRAMSTCKSMIASTTIDSKTLDEREL
jgi:hypothetical protein